jgi:hypothetical protein
VPHCEHSPSDGGSSLPRSFDSGTEYDVAPENDPADDPYVSRGSFDFFLLTSLMGVPHAPHLITCPAAPGGISTFSPHVGHEMILAIGFRFYSSRLLFAASLAGRAQRRLEP